MALLDSIAHARIVKSHRPWPRAIVAEAGWRQAIGLLAAGRVTLLGLWVEGTSDVTVLTYGCKSGNYPSVAARHAPAIRLERAIRDLYGLEAVDAPDTRPWLDLGFWSVRHPLGGKARAVKPAPYQFLPVEGEGLQFRLGRCMPASSSPATSASPPMANLWSGSSSGSAGCTRAPSR
jgi:hypothetical protein